MKRLLPFLFLICFCQLEAQKNIDGLINAEKSFAAYSVAHGTKDAFLQFLDSNGIVFDSSKPVNGMELWKKRERRPRILNWKPQFAEISMSNDFGYTTGPWIFLKSIDDTNEVRGQYFTIWHYKDSAWKFLLDLGTSNNPSGSFDAITKIDVTRSKGNDRSISGLLKAEKHFIADAKNAARAYQMHLSHQQSLLIRNNHLPAVSKEEQQKIIQSTPYPIFYTIKGYGMATSGDLGFIYGTTNLSGKVANYVRVWRKEKGGWKIAAELLRY
jgi:hypothetical protein